MMSDPKRLMNFSAGDWGATDEVSAMGRELLGSLDPTPAERERVLGRVIASAGLMAGATATVALSAKAGAAGASQVATASLTAGGMSLATKLGLFLLVAVPITATSAYWLVAAGAGEPASTSSAHSNSALPNSLAVETPQDEGAGAEVPPTGRTPSEADSDFAQDPKRDDVAASELTSAQPRFTTSNPTASKSSSRASGASASSSLEEEDRLLRSARQMAKSGDTKAALAALHSLDQRFPQGVLLQERELLRISVLNQSGRESQAEKRAEEFRQQYPDSPYGASTEKK